MKKLLFGIIFCILLLFIANFKRHSVDKECSPWQTDTKNGHYVMQYKTCVTGSEFHMLWMIFDE